MPHTKPIILVDDDHDDLELVQHALEDLGVKNQQLCFKNGEEALNYLKSTKTATFLIISDLNMPRLNGIDLKKEINKDDNLRKQSIPFIYMSTSSSPKEIELAYELTVQGFFEKPSKYEELKHTMKVIIGYWTASKQPANK